MELLVIVLVAVVAVGTGIAIGVLVAVRTPVASGYAQMHGALAEGLRDELKLQVDVPQRGQKFQL